VRQITIRLGELDFDTTRESNHIDIQPTSIQQHQSYENRTYHNDIAIISLPRPVNFNTFIRPICLPPAGPLYVDERPTVAGWGTLQHKGQQSRKLMKVKVPVWTNADCDATYDQTIIPKMMCAASKTGGQDSCRGDSGGPLMIQQGSTWSVVGIVSWGIRCAEKDKPGVYTRVNEYLPWIQQNSL